METSAITQILRLPAKYSIIDFVVGHLLALGMRLTVLEIAAPLRRPRLVVLALATNFVLGPVFAYLFARLISLLIPLEQGYMTGLMIIGSAAGSPMLPKWVKLAKGDLGFGFAIMVLLMGTSIFYLPVVLPRLISGVNVGTRRMLALRSGQQKIEAVLLVATTSVADPKVLVIAVIAALVIFIMLLGTAVVFGHGSGLAEHKAMPRSLSAPLRHGMWLVCCKL